MKQYITIGEVAKSLGVSTIKVNTMIRQGKVRVAKYSEQKSGKGKLRLFEPVFFLQNTLPSQSHGEDPVRDMVLPVLFGMFLGVLFVSFFNFILQILK